MITLQKLPFPVSVNAAYANIKRSRFGPITRIKSKKYQEYDRAFSDWCLCHSKDVKEARALVKEMGLFELHIILYLPKSRLFNKKGEIKKLDCSNFIKTCEDKITEILGFDDSRIFACSVIKTPNPENLIGSWCDVIIEEHKLSLT